MLERYCQSNWGNNLTKISPWFRKSALSPFPNLETQHDGRSARIWKKRVDYFCGVVEGQKGFAREHQNGFYKT